MQFGLSIETDVLLKCSYFLTPYVALSQVYCPDPFGTIYKYHILYIYGWIHGYTVHGWMDGILTSVIDDLITTITAFPVFGISHLHVNQTCSNSSYFY